MTAQFDTPILFLIFNRPDTTRRIFNEIKKARPRKLFIAADGPRPDKPEDTERCRLTREVVKNVDWPCGVKTLFRDKNLGCKIGISAAINWFFEHVEAGIIFEDDCLPDQSFFPYCEELLEKYKDDKRIMNVSGDNFQQHNPHFYCPDSYYFSRLPNCWGWATWKRAWKLFDIDIKLWPQARADKMLYKIFQNSAVAHRWEYLFDQDAVDRSDPKPIPRLDWDGRWVFACFVNNGVCIYPRSNLVSNIGFDANARIAHNPDDPLANLPLQPVSIPLKHPQEIKINLEADNYTHKYIYNINRYRSQRIKWFFKSRFTKQYLLLKKIRHRIWLSFLFFFI